MWSRGWIGLRLLRQNPRCRQSPTRWSVLKVWRSWKSWRVWKAWGTRNRTRKKTTMRRTSPARGTPSQFCRRSAPRHRRTCLQGIRHRTSCSPTRLSGRRRWGGCCRNSSTSRCTRRTERTRPPHTGCSSSPWTGRCRRPGR